MKRHRNAAPRRSSTYQREIATMNRFATFARLAGIATVSMLVVFVTRTPASMPETAGLESATASVAHPAASYLPAQYVEEERAAHASELPAQF
jgi:hypothetical protein